MYTCAKRRSSAATAVARSDQIVRRKHGVRSVQAKVCGQHSIRGQNPIRIVPKIETYRLIDPATTNTIHRACLKTFTFLDMGNSVPGRTGLSENEVFGNYDTLQG